MRDYTTIPSAFRVDSLQTVNNGNNNQHNNNNNNNNNNYNNNSSNNHGNDGNHALSSTTTTTTTQAIVHSGSNPNNNNNNNNDAAAGGGAESVAIRINYPHKLTAIAAIERHCHASEINADRNVGMAHSSARYATLPRGFNNPAQMGMLNGNLLLLPTRQINKPSTSALSSPLAGDEQQRIINTISGSIPSTGFTATINNTNNINNLDRLGSFGSDLNISLTDFSQLNSIEQQQHLMSSAAAVGDFRLLRPAADVENYQHFHGRRLSQKPFDGLQRKNDNSYLWILTPVAAR